MWGINADVLEADVSPLIEKHTGGGAPNNHPTSLQRVHR